MKASIPISLILFFLFSSCEKKYDIDDISSFELNYNIGSGWPSYFYLLQLNETGELDIQSKRPFSESIRHSVYSINNPDLLQLKPYLVDLLNSDINEKYGVGPDKATDLAVTTLSIKTNKKQIDTYIYQPNESELPESLNRIIGELSNLKVKYDTLFNF
ncbi:MAG: hypothetical protein IPJ16_02130 [Bacteroidales bacterium]|nr:hypothetical protein [Bacteroidales bacterium]